MIRKYLFVLSLVLFTNSVFTQVWLNNLPQNKSKSELTFFDYKNAFDSYWSSYNVKNGYYFVDGIKKKAIGWKQFKRWEYNMQSQINPVTGEFNQQSSKEVYDEFLKNKTREKSANSSNWVSLGSSNSDGGYSGIGRISCVAFHPTDNNTFWAGSAGGGLWVTTTNGASWISLTDNLGTLLISDIAIPTDFNTSSTIYLATGDKDVSWESHSLGVLKSTDGGVTWNTTGLSFSSSANVVVNKLILDPTNNNVLIAATSNGVYKTVDGGNTWNNQLTSINFIDIEYKPNDFDILYGSTSNGKIYNSVNGGLNWVNVFNNSEARRIELAVSPIESTKVYAIASNSEDGLYGIYSSTNSGLNFSQVFDGSTSNLLGYEADGSSVGGQGWYDLTIAASPITPNSLVIGGVNAWGSIDGGNSWNILSHWWGDGVQAVHADKHMQRYRNNGDLFECNDGGIYLSVDDGSTWEDKTNGMIISQMYRLSVSKTNSTEIIAGLQDNGTKLFSNGNWSDVKGGDGMECIIDYNDDNIQYGTYVNGQISKTGDHWLTSNEIQPADAGDGSWVTPYIIDPINSEILYAGYENVWRTNDGGLNWEQISTMSTSAKIQSMAIAPSNTNILYVADDNTIWKTINGGGDWSNITSNLPSNSGGITYLTVNNNDPNTAWVTLGGFSSNKVYQTINGGIDWQNISTGLPQIPVYTLVQNKQSSENVQLYVGTDIGVYFKDGTNDWESYNTGLPNVKVNELEIYYSPNIDESRLRAATYGRGLWESPITSPGTPICGIATSSSLCISNSISLSLAGYSGNIQWQQSSDGLTNWTNISTGTGFNSATFIPESLQTKTSFRAEVTLPGSPSTYSNILTINSLPIVSMASLSTACSTDPSIILNQGSPSGGVYSGTGVSNGSFLPSTVLPGVYKITYTFIDTNQCASSNDTDIQVNLCGGNELFDGVSYLLYPNPVKGILTLYYNNNEYKKVKIFDNEGRLVVSEDLSESDSKIFIDLNKYADGIYTVQIISNSEIENTQIVIKK